MDDCAVCYNPIKNKVLLECSHDFCLKCLVNILKTKDDGLLCPLCRRKYNEIYINKSIEEEEEDISINIDILKHDDGLIKQLLINYYPFDQCKFYEAYVKYNNTEAMISFYVLHNIDIENHQIESLIFNLITDHLPLDNIIQKLRNGSSKTGQYKMTNHTFYLQDFYDIFIERVEHI